MNTRVARLAGLLIATLLAVGACGGSSGGGFTATPPPPPPPPVGGITRTGVAFAVGPVTTFGSVVVNGVTYDTSAATFTNDGQQATQADLAVGDVVVVRGSIDDNDMNAVATSVSFDDNVEGPVSSVDAVNNSIVVLGQTVFVTADTSFDDSCPATLNELLNVAAVEVSGLVAADGSISATRIECKAALGVMEVTGVVSSLGASTFMINALVVDFTNVPAVLDNFPSGSISSGDPVEAKGISLGPNGELLATRVEFKGAGFGENEGDHIEVEGFITRYISASDFDVSDIPVTTTGTTVYEGGIAGDLGPNIKVEVEGEFNANGVLVATKVDIKRAKSVRITALLDSVAADSFVMLGITIRTDMLTRLEDKSDQDQDPLTLANLAAGNYVEVRGQEFPAGSGEVLATILERDDSDPDSILQGFVEVNGVNRPTLSILGVTVETNAQTVFRDENNALIPNPDDFWAQVQDGSLIKAKGIETSSQTIVAEEVELELE